MPFSRGRSLAVKIPLLTSLLLPRPRSSRHGGRVWAEGKSDGGATFYFTLDCKPS